MQTCRGNRGEKGSIMFLGALTMVVVTAFMGLAVDACYMYYHRRAMQAAADAGAYGGALEILRGNSSNITSAAKNDSSLNGFADGSDNVTVTVNAPPTSGTKTGDTNFVEVIVSHPQPTWFMNILHFDTVQVKARAVAGIGSTGNGCVYTLNRDTSNSNNGFFVNGTTNSAFACGVFSNANFRAVGGACVVAPTVNYTGTYSNSSSGTDCGPGNVTAGVPVVDPLLNKFSIPSYGSCTANNYKVTNGTTVTIPSGTYCGGISISGSVQNIVFSGGSYILVGGGLTINGSVNVTGTGVTFFDTYPNSQSNKYGAISITGSGTVNLSAPTSGTYKGLLFYQDPRVSWSASNGSSISGGANSVYDGIIYFPTTDLQYSGNSSATPNGTDGYTILVGYDIKVNGTAKVNEDYSAIGGISPIQNALFAE
jgi:hypothetical protein